MTDAEKKVLVTVSKGSVTKQIIAGLLVQYKKNGWTQGDKKAPALRRKEVQDGN